MSDLVNLSDRRQPVTYSVTITHHWDGRLEVFVADVADDERSRESVADALLRAAQTFGAKRTVESAEEARLMRGIGAAMGCLNPESSSRDERLAWFRLYDAEMGLEPRASLEPMT